jgi:hypothetical protein
MNRLAIGLAALAASVALGACGGRSGSSDPTGEIRSCLKKAGATIVADSTPLAFALGPDIAGEVDDSGLDNSGTLSVGSIRGTGGADWEIFYVARKGYEVSLTVLARNPEKAAKVVAYVKPADPATVEAASDCLSG